MPNKHLKAGIAEIDITPSHGVELAAEFQPRKAAGVAERLMAKALVLSNDTSIQAILTLDLFGLNPLTAGELEMIISQRTGIKPEALMVVCSRTRGAPYTTPLIGASGMDQAYLNLLLDRLPGCVEQALQNQQEASLGVGHAMLPHLVYNHRWLTRNYKAISAWLDVPANEVLAPEGPVDPTFTVITLRDQRGFPICLSWNFAADFRFPLDDMISSGVPGGVQKKVDERLGRHVPVFYLPGCVGNTCFAWDLDKTLDAVTSAVVAVYLETSCDPYIRLGFSAERMVLPLRDYSQLWMEADIELKYPQSLDIYRHELSLLQQEGARAVSTQVKAFRLGDFGMVGFPGTPFVEFALQTRQKSPFGKTAIVGNVGGDIGLIIPRLSFDAGGYEAWIARSARIGPGAGEFMAEAAGQLLADL